MADKQTGIESVEQPFAQELQNPDFSLHRLKQKLGGRLQVLTLASALSVSAGKALAETPETAYVDIPEQAEQLPEVLKPMDYQWGYEVIGALSEDKDYALLNRPPVFVVRPNQIEQTIATDQGTETLTAALSTEDFHRSLVHIEEGTIHSVYLDQLLRDNDLPGLSYGVGGPNAVPGEFDDAPLLLQRILPEEIPALPSEDELATLEEVRMQEFFKKYAQENALPEDVTEWADEDLEMAMLAHVDANVEADSQTISWHDGFQEGSRERQDEIDRRMTQRANALLERAKKEQGLN